MNVRRRASRQAAEDQLQPAAPSVLEQNLNRLRVELTHYPQMRKVAFVGQPGAGKSTLMDWLTERSLSPRPLVGQRTDATHWGSSLHIPLLHRYRNHILVDSPGYDTHAHPVDTLLRFFPFQSFDRIVLVLQGKIHAADDKLLTSLTRNGLRERTLVARGFAESLAPEETEEVLAELRLRYAGRVVLFSNRTKLGLNEIKEFTGL